MVPRSLLQVLLQSCCQQPKVHPARSLHSKETKRRPASRSSWRSRHQEDTHCPSYQQEAQERLAKQVLAVSWLLFDPLCQACNLTCGCPKDYGDRSWDFRLEVANSPMLCGSFKCAYCMEAQQCSFVTSPWSGWLLHTRRSWEGSFVRLGYVARSLIIEKIYQDVGH